MTQVFHQLIHSSLHCDELHLFNVLQVLKTQEF